MGQGLPKAATPIVLERHAGPRFRVGLAEMNGWRPSMEDSHVVVMKDSWGFFGVFDGHGGQQCSSFVARRLHEELEKSPAPASDAEVKELMLRLDREFLELKQPSGSTGTFVLVEIPSDSAQDSRYRLRVGNIGDSRVLLGRIDGTMVEGSGTDGGLTTDHKPDHEVEKERIYRTGGKVETIMGVARVNGDLAVSRAFGDAPHKQTGGPKQEDHPVTVDPEFCESSCSSTDFLMLVCDGISEGDFPNRQAVSLAAEELQKSAEVNGGIPDAAKAAAAVCRRALQQGSMDNLSCMIVLFGGSTGDHSINKDFLPGPLSAPTHAGFRKAYSAMAERAGLTFEQAVERRYDAARKESETDNAMADLRVELAAFGEGPPAELKEGAERTMWFKTWLDSHQVEPQLDLSSMSRDQILEMLAKDPSMLAMAQAQGFVSQATMRMVRVSEQAVLQPAIEEHPGLKWDDRLIEICGKVGKVLQDDDSDGTSQVRFRDGLAATVWLPTSTLIDLEGQQVTIRKKVRVGTEEELRKAVEEHPLLNWQEEMSQLPGALALAVKEDRADATTRVRFPPPLCFDAWLPSSVLHDAEQTEESDSDDAGGEEGDSEDSFDLMDKEVLRVVVVGSEEKLREEVSKNDSLQWNDNMLELCGKRGEVIADDDADGTSQVCFGPPICGTAWLPQSVLTEVQPDEEAEQELDSPQEESSPKRQRTE